MIIEGVFETEGDEVKLKFELLFSLYIKLSCHFKESEKLEISVETLRSCLKPTSPATPFQLNQSSLISISNPPISAMT
jgi:hypothetical protein